MKRIIVPRIDRILYRCGLVRRKRYDRLYSAYRDVWSWWEKAIYDKD